MSGAASLAEGEPEGALNWREADQCQVVSKQICCTIDTLATPNTVLIIHSIMIGYDKMPELS